MGQRQGCDGHLLFLELSAKGSLTGTLGTSFPVRTLSTSETEMSTTCQEYKSTSGTAVTSSISSLLKTQSSDLLENGEDLKLSHRPRENEAARGQSRRPSQTAAAPCQSRRPSEMKAAQGQGQRPSKTEAAQGQSGSSSETEATRCARRKPNKTKAARGPRQRFRKTKVAHGHSWGPSKAATQGQCWGLIRSPSKTKDFCDPSWSPSSTEATQDQCQKPSKTDAAQSLSQSTSPGSSKTEVTKA